MDHCNKFKYKSPIENIKPVLPLLAFERQGPVRLKAARHGGNSEKPTGQRQQIQVRFLFTSFIASDVQQCAKQFHAFVMKFSHLLHIRVVHPDFAKVIQTHNDALNSNTNSTQRSFKYGNKNKQISMLQTWLVSNACLDSDSFCG